MKKPRYSRATDVWALGVSMYEVMRLELPFKASTLGHLPAIVAHDEVELHEHEVTDGIS